MISFMFENVWEGDIGWICEVGRWIWGIGFG